MAMVCIDLDHCRFPSQFARTLPCLRGEADMPVQCISSHQSCNTCTTSVIAAEHGKLQLASRLLHHLAITVHIAADCSQCRAMQLPIRLHESCLECWSNKHHVHQLLVFPELGISTTIIKLFTYSLSLHN